MCLNPNNGDFKTILNSEIYVDKTEMIEQLNRFVGTYEPLVCITRPRRFGKTMAANMISAYYSKGCESKELFKGLKVEKACSFEKHLNKHNVLYFDLQELMHDAMDAKEDDHAITPMRYIQKTLIQEFIEAYPDIVESTDKSLPKVLRKVYARTEEKFIIIIDEWDCIYRNQKNDSELLKEYRNFMESMFKAKNTLSCIDLAYITGILPIKKYGGQSPMNGFQEFTMTDPSWFAPYVGFTEDEVKDICERYRLDFSEVQRWYDGYLLETIDQTSEENKVKTLHIYSPNSVIKAAMKRQLESYWTATETYESIKEYIVMNLDGLKDAIIQLLGNETVSIDAKAFQNDMTSMNSKDDVLSLLVHLGYLGYKQNERTVFIPNEEVREELIRTVKDTGWKEIVETIQNSDRLIADTINGNADEVAKAIELVHEQNTSILNYNE